MFGYEQIAAVVMPPLVGWIGLFELRLRNRVSKDRFNDLKAQTDRVESHLWDLMKDRGITPSMDVPENLKNNGE